MQTEDALPEYFICSNFNSLTTLYGEEFVTQAAKLCDSIISSDLVKGVSIIRTLIENVQAETIKNLYNEGRIK